ncbi:unnamed protein product [Polarella glacialis]|uniref:Prolyl 4-hydroxylase alpha subunit domain-containing protein n=1 Tax=Polarella glacialis TaxID=89957 RepID=A0A813DH74_POLGL|nr:unnamed protein product [Polarella glacialis]CAE8652533.1 unnamed protein product [Polarella glacialis]
MELRDGVDFVRIRSSEYSIGSTSRGDSAAQALWELRSSLLHDTPKLSEKQSSEPVVGIPGAFTVAGLLSEDECDSFVCFLEQVGFLESKVIAKVTANRKPWMRHNDVSVIVIPERMATELSRRLKPFIPGYGAGENARCSPNFINTCLRCYRYRFECRSNGEPGVPHGVPHFFGPHHDIEQQPMTIVGGMLQEDTCRRSHTSQMSVLFYLSGGHQGGDTIFEPPPSNTTTTGDTTTTGISVAPVKGGALCFWHGQHSLSPAHSGSALSAGPGPKYVIRTDVFFDTEED